MGDHVSTIGLGAVGSVLTILTTAAGLNLRQMAAQNARLVKTIKQRDLDKDKLNKELLSKGERLGQLLGVKERADSLQLQFESLVRKYDALDDAHDSLTLKYEVQTLENVGLRQRIARLEEKLKERKEDNEREP